MPIRIRHLVRTRARLYGARLSGAVGLDETSAQVLA
jgi:hypothetical protein